MRIDLMVGTMAWRESAALAAGLQAAGWSGMTFTETSQTPWMAIAHAATAAPRLHFSTGIAVAFPRSPMIAAQIAWELAANTEGRFRLGLGSQVRGHVVRRYGATFGKPAAHMRDYAAAFKACIRAFRGEERLHHDGPHYQLSSLPKQWAPPRHGHEDVKLDIAAVGPQMCQVAGELCDGLHVHPMHSLPYIEQRLLPAVAAGAERAGRSATAIDLIVPVFAIAGDTPEERAPKVRRARTQIAFYGSTPNYAFQFDDLGFHGVGAELNRLMRAGKVAEMADVVSDEMLDAFTTSARWDDMADALARRYRGVAATLVMYLALDDIRQDPASAAKWGEVARAVAAPA